MLPTISGEFRLVADPEMRFTPSGHAVASLRLVASKRKKDERTQEWVDDKILWLDGSIWRQAAENVVESLRKGDLVEVRGALYTNSWEDNEGNKRSTIKMDIYSIGPSLAYATAKVTRAERGSGQSSSDPWQGSADRNAEQRPAADDPWSTTPSAQADTDPPF